MSSSCFLKWCCSYHQLTFHCMQHLVLAAYLIVKLPGEDNMLLEQACLFLLQLQLLLPYNLNLGHSRNSSIEQVFRPFEVNSCHDVGLITRLNDARFKPNKEATTLNSERALPWYLEPKARHKNLIFTCLNSS